MTGETGAGKSLLVDALSFVLGGPVDRGVIRAGAATASVDAVFRLPPSLTELRAALAELGHEPDEDGTLVLSRETHREGNTVSRLNGRAVPVRVAREVGERLVDIHGQGQHLALFDPGFQLAVLDAFGGLQAKRDAVARAVAEVRDVEAEMSRLMSDAHRVAERSDLLRFQAGEIRAADLKPGEEAALTEERDVLANARAIQEACAAAYELLYDAGSNASDLLAQAVQALRRAPGPLRTLAPSIDALEQSAAQIDDAAREIRGYVESLESDPARLGEIEDRLELVRRLKRKYGGGEEAALAFAADAERQLAEEEHADRRTSRPGSIASMREGWPGSSRSDAATPRRRSTAKPPRSWRTLTSAAFASQPRSRKLPTAMACLAGRVRTATRSLPTASTVEFAESGRGGQAARPSGAAGETADHAGGDRRDADGGVRRD